MRAAVWSAALFSGGMALAGGLASGGCGPRGGGTAAVPGRVAWFGAVRPPRDDVFRFNNQAEPENLDPGLMSGQPDGRVARMLFEGLTVPDPKTLAPLPGQARSWDVSADGRTYTFHLRPGNLWTDGTAVRAEDFRWSWMRVLAPATGARYAALLYGIRNARAYNKGDLKDSTQVGLAAPDDTTFVVTLETPKPYFLFLTEFYTCLPVPRRSVELWGDRWVRPEHIVTNGPFTLTTWRPNDRFVFARNPRYWDAAHVRLQRIEAYPVDDLNTSVNLYKSGAIDWNPSGSVPTPFLPYMRQYSDLRTGPFQAVYFYSINVTRKPLDDPRVRLALNYALDRDAIANQLLRRTRPPWGSFCPRGYPGYHNADGYRFDPRRARALLAEAGYPGGQGFRRILINTSEDHRRIAEAIQGMWKKELGIDVAVSNQEWGSYLQATTTLHYDVARRSWIGDYLDPYTFLSIMATGDGNNRTGWSDPEYDRLLAEAEREGDAPKRLALLRRSEDVLLERGPIIPVYHYATWELLKPYVHGIEQNVLDVHDLKAVWIDHGAHPEGPRLASRAGSR